VIDLQNLTDHEHSRIGELIADPLLDAAFASLIAKYISDWRSTSKEQASDREHAYNMLQAVGDLQSELRSIASNRKVRDFNNKTRG
jgi:hypothetical protein